MTTRYCFVAELTPVIDSAGTTQKFLFATEGFATGASDTPANTVVRELLSDPGSIRRELFTGARVTGENRPSFGQVVLINADGVLDDWLDYGIAGTKVIVRYGEAGAAYPSAFSTVFIAYAQFLIVDFNQVRLVIRDRLHLLDAPIVTDVFLGNGGLEGTGISTGTKQMVFGRPGFIPPRLIDQNREIYFVQANAADERAFRSTFPPLYLVFEGGRGLNFQRYCVSEADFLATTPTAGYFTIYGPGVDGLTPLTFETVGGVYVRLGSPPEYDIRIPTLGLLKNSTTEYARAWRFTDLCKRAGLTVTLATGSYENTTGNFLVDADQTYLQVMSDACASTFSSYGFNSVDEFFTIDLKDPTEDADAAVYTFNTHNSKAINRQAVPGQEAPVWQVQVNSGRTWPGSTRTSLTSEERDIFTRQPWQNSFTGTAVSVRTANPGAETATVEIIGNDLDSPAARLAYVQRYIYLFGCRRDLLTLTAPFSTDLLAIDLHSKVEVKMPRLGCAAGRLFRVVTIQMDLRTRLVTYGLWGGDPGPVDAILGGGATSPGGGSGPPVPLPPGYQTLIGFEQYAYGTVGGGGGGGNSTLNYFAQLSYGTVANPQVTIVGYCEQSSVPENLAITAHDANDLIILFLRSTSTTPPSTPSGWTSIASFTGSFDFGWRVVTQVDTANTISSIPSATANQMAALITRGGVVGDVQVGADVAGGTTLALPALTFTGTPGLVKVIAGASINQGTTLSTPSLMTLQGTNESPSLGGGTWGMWTSTDPETTFTGRTTTLGTAAFGAGYAIELKPA